MLEDHVRAKLREWVQDLLEQDIAELLGRELPVNRPVGPPPHPRAGWTPGLRPSSPWVDRLGRY